jgi:hypothetical protein
VTYYRCISLLGTVTEPGSIQYRSAILLVALLVSYVGMVYGPIAAFLAEYFPARIRYTSVSVPYHIGNGWGGRAGAHHHDLRRPLDAQLGSALVYPIVVPAVAFVLGPCFMPETRQDEHLGQERRRRSWSRARFAL